MTHPRQNTSAPDAESSWTRSSRRTRSTALGSSEVPGRRLPRRLGAVAATAALLLSTATTAAASAGQDGGEQLPDDVSQEDTQEVLADSDAITEDDLRYAAAAEDLAASTASEFYATPATLPEQNGALIRQEESLFYLDPIRLIEHDADVTRIMYRTTDQAGEARAAVATVLEPSRDRSQDDEVIVQAPGTQGMGDHCAPSRQLSAGSEYEGISIATSLEAGYTVVVPDYIGLGTESEHTYMDREDQAHAVLDAARASRQAEGVGLDEESKFHLRGYSQGGAAAAALEIAHEWAPELNLVSGAAGAVPADLQDVVEQIDGSLYNAFLLFALGGLSESEGLDPADFLNAEGLSRLEQASGQCTISAVASHMFVDTSTLTVDGSSFTELVQKEPLASALEKQRIGQGRAPEVPVQLNHSRLDDVIPHTVGHDLASRWCEGGSRATFRSTVAPTHIGGYAGGLPGVALFTARTMDGSTPLSSCWRL